MLTIGASHSVAAWRHFSRGTMSLSDVEYSRIRPQPVHVRLQVCSGSSCKTIANFGVLRSLCLMMWLAIFFVSAKGNRINELDGNGIRGRHARNLGCRRRIGLDDARQKEVQRRNRARSADAATT